MNHPVFGDPRLPKRFWLNVIVGGGYGCWRWIGHTALGYGRFNRRGQPEYTHRIAYEALVEALPKGMTLDHRCMRKNCCNPEHLEPVSRSENFKRARYCAKIRKQEQY